MKRFLPHASERGFTMVVIAALFVAFSVVATAIVERNTVTQQITRRDATVAQLTKLSNAIIEYSVFNRNGTNVNLYPCPADITLISSSANFGVSVNNAGTQNCYNTAPTGVHDNGSNVLEGMVPVQTLSQYGIGAEDAFDPWNNKIVYVVNRQLTPGGSGTQSNSDPKINPTAGVPWSGYAIPIPDFILISLGKDGIGAYKRNQASAGITCSTGTTRIMLENCDQDTEFYFAPTYTAGDAVSTGVTTSFTTNAYFDDILTYYRQ